MYIIQVVHIHRKVCKMETLNIVGIISENKNIPFIKEMLKRIGEFTPFVEKCYCSFLKSSIYVLVEFYNHFSEFTITKISKFDNFNCIYEKESLDT